MVFHRANPANFEGPGGEEYDPERFKQEGLRAELVELAGTCCFQHGARVVDKILEDYKITPRSGRKYP